MDDEVAEALSKAQDALAEVSMLLKRPKKNSLKDSLDTQLQRAYEWGHNRFVALVQPNSWSALTMNLDPGFAHYDVDRAGRTLKYDTDWGVVILIQQEHSSITKVTVRSWRE